MMQMLTPESHACLRYFYFSHVLGSGWKQMPAPKKIKQNE